MESENQMQDATDALGSNDMPSDQDEVQAKKNGFMNKLRNTRVSRNVAST